jgi:cation diffusion facilitator family transporter
MKQKPIISHENQAIKTTYFSIASNAILAIIKIISGVLGNSFALIADGIESTADLFASVLVYLGLKYATLPPDENHPYGHGKIEPLVTFVIVAFLVISAFLIAFQSILQILTPQNAPESWTLWVLGSIIIWKEASYRYVLYQSKQTNSSSLKADAWHHRSDAITSIAAFIGISIAVIWGEGFESADDWAALFAAFIILYNSYHIFRPALAEIMDEHTHDELQLEIRRISLSVDGILGTEKCHIRKTGMTYYVDLHAIVSGNISVVAGHKLSHNLKDELMAKIPQIGDVLIHIEPDEHD